MNKKSILVLLCVFTLVAASVFGTLAYLTDSDSNINTFTVGKIGLELDEAEVNPNGTVKSENRVTENVYHLLPGHTYVKDPTIHVDADSEDCYLFVKVENGIADIETTEETKTIATQMKELGWKPVEGYDELYIFAKEDKLDKYVLSKGANVVVFNEFTVDGDNVVNVPEGETLPEGSSKVNIAGYNRAAIKVTAYAVQKDGFESKIPAQIWAETFGKA